MLTQIDQKQAVAAPPGIQVPTEPMQIQLGRPDSRKRRGADAQRHHLTYAQVIWLEPAARPQSKSMLILIGSRFVMIAITHELGRFAEEFRRGQGTAWVWTEDALLAQTI